MDRNWKGQLRSDDLFGSSPQGVGRKIKVIPRYSRSFGEARIFHLGGKNCSTEGGIVRSNEGKNFSTWNKAKIVPRLNVPVDVCVVSITFTGWKIVITILWPFLFLLLPL